MKNWISNIEVSDFKTKYCDENQIITKIITNDLYDYFIEPILDVGTGPGDIVYKALFKKEVICIDINKIDETDFPLSKNHVRIEVNFFDYKPIKKIETIFISHTLQFLDDDIDRLNTKINSIAPYIIILVQNKNNDIFGELINWAKQNVPSSNPEIKYNDFPVGYNLIRAKDFNAHITCPSFEDLATQISYLFLLKLTKRTRSKLITFLRNRITLPEFYFNQTIEIYEKNK